jgi:hypothetical protein
VLCFSAVGCADSTCTQRGCGHSQAAEFQFAEERPWAEEQGAAYRFDLTTETDAYSCTGVVGEAEYSCDSDQLWLQDTEEGGFHSLSLATFPPSATLTITRDDAVVFEQTYEIDPVVEYPNGEGCGTCRWWETAVAW